MGQSHHNLHSAPLALESSAICAPGGAQGGGDRLLADQGSDAGRYAYGAASHARARSKGHKAPGPCAYDLGGSQRSGSPSPPTMHHHTHQRGHARWLRNGKPPKGTQKDPVPCHHGLFCASATQIHHFFFYLKNKEVKKLKNHHSVPLPRYSRAGEEQTGLCPTATEGATYFGPSGGPQLCPRIGAYTPTMYLHMEDLRPFEPMPRSNWEVIASVRERLASIEAKLDQMIAGHAVIENRMTTLETKCLALDYERLNARMGLDALRGEFEAYVAQQTADRTAVDLTIPQFIQWRQRVDTMIKAFENKELFNRAQSVMRARDWAIIGGTVVFASTLATAAINVGRIFGW